MSVRIITGDCREVLRTLPDESVHCVVTSPPYFGLRDYGASGQIGLEPSPDEFVDELVAVFRDVRRALRSDGTCWINLGDSYANDGKWGGHTGGKHVKALHCSSIGRNKRYTGLKPKDLVGIPWRVAFALQAPQYLGRIARETDRAWLAALTDGEGCISILETTSGRDHGPVSTSYPPILQVRMCDRECIDKAMAIVGSESESPAQYPASMGGTRPAYQWRIHGRKAADTIAEIYPFLLIKRKQAIVAWNAQAAREGYETKRGVKVPVEASEKQKLCREIIQKLNQRQPVDLPSWMVEPPQPFGPGWYLRQDVIWSKPNPMPESVTDRCTKAHEYMFLLAKGQSYYFDQDAILEPVSASTVERLSQPGVDNQEGSWRVPGKTNGAMKAVSRSGNRAKSWGVNETDIRVNGEGKVETQRGIPWEGSRRNKRSVWTVSTQPFSEAHFATFPPALIEPCILAGCPEGGTVVDPFFGAGTTGLVCDRLKRNCIGIELNPAYAAMAERRIRGDSPLLAEVATGAAAAAV